MRMHMHTRLELADQVVALVKDHHPYDVPNVTAVPLVAGNADYFAWIEAETDRCSPRAPTKPRISGARTPLRRAADRSRERRTLLPTPVTAAAQAGSSPSVPAAQWHRSPAAGHLKDSIRNPP